MNTKGFVHKLRSILQANHNRLVVIGLLFIFIMSACGEATPTPAAEPIVDTIQIAVAATINARETAFAASTATASPTPSFTVTPPPTSTSHTYWDHSTNYGCYDSEYIKDMNIPDGTVIAPGESFTKTWKFENTGNCTWDSDLLIVFVDGDDLDGSDEEIGKTVKVNKRGDVSVYLTAPNHKGNYAGYWSLADEHGHIFGEWVYVEIVVSSTATKTPTPTPTATSTSTLTPTPTGSPVATDTPTPTPTPTDDPLSTDTSTPTETPTLAPIVPPTV